MQFPVSKLHRRDFLVAAVALSGAVGLSDLAQAQSGRVYRVGLLAREIGGPEASLLEALAAKGYREGRNMTLLSRLYGNNLSAIDSYAAELVAQKPDLIIASANPDTLALHKLTSVIPVVMRRSYAPLELGFIRSYGRPGLNITGVTHWQPSEDGKSMQIIHDVLPGARRYCTLYDPRLVGISFYKEQQAKACKQLGLDLALVQMRDESDLKKYYKQAIAEKHQVLEFVDSGFMAERRDELLAFCQKHRIFTMSSREEAVKAGAVMARIPDTQEQPERCAMMIDRIFKGVSPADIPVEGPMRYELLFNEAAAKKLGIQVPRAFRVQVTKFVS